MSSRHKDKPVVLVTGAAGDIGSSLAEALKDGYRVVGLDRDCEGATIDCFEADITSDDSLELAFGKIRKQYGHRFASVVHLAAYFDFTGEESPLYETVNVEGTQRLLAALQQFTVEQFVYSGTMLVHAPGKPGQMISEDSPIAPAWPYPQSKAAAEEVIRKDHGGIPYVLLHLAGLYDDEMAVPTLSHQIARIYERDPKAHLFPGDLSAGQAMIHKNDMIDAFRRTIDRRANLPADVTILVGEADVMSFEELQSEIGRLVHDEANWATVRVPKFVAKPGAWLEEKSEPVVPDSMDQGEKPFIRPFMVDMADQHYALDIQRAKELLDWTPQHSIRKSLPRLIDALKADPAKWYKANGITLPPWMDEAAEMDRNPETLRQRHEAEYRKRHQATLWAPFLNLGLGIWLVTAPALLGYESRLMTWSDVLSGVGVLIFSLLSLSWRYGWARWANAAIGVWLLFAPLAFWAPTAAAYTNGTLVGALVIGFAILIRPPPGVSPLAAQTGPVVPPGWSFTPSSWTQRLPIIILAFVGLYVSRYLAAYQLGHIDGVWDPFFPGGPDPKNGTEEIITSSISEAWPVSDAGVGALTYMIEILTGIIGSTARWRTMPWLVILFGILIVPLGVVSITFIVIQPIVIGTWCTLCLIAAAAMLLQIPYSLDELAATSEFLLRRYRQGHGFVRIFLVGDTDTEDRKSKGAKIEGTEFERSARGVVGELVGGGVGLPWNLGVCLIIGVWLMFTRATLGAEGPMANADHLIGALVVTTTVAAMAEVARPLRFVNMGFGMALLIMPFILEADSLQMVAGAVCGLALIAFSIRRGSIRQDYGGWSRFIV